LKLSKTELELESAQGWAPAREGVGAATFRIGATATALEVKSNKIEVRAAGRAKVGTSP